MKKKCNNWKPVEIHGNVLSGSVEGLIGIEECTDYDLNDIVTKKVVKRKLAPTSKNVVSKKNKKSKKETREEPLLPSKFGNTHNSTEFPHTEILDDLTDMQAWDMYGLPKLLIKGLKDLNFLNPTQIQLSTLPSAILGRRDILGAAETGSGKTLAFGLPILAGIMNLKENNPEDASRIVDENISDTEESDFENDSQEHGTGCVKLINNIDIKGTTPLKPLYALILTPTRELAMQIKNHLVAVAKHTGINIAVVVGGLAAVKQTRILSKCPEIVVATPGRLWELIQEGDTHLSQIDNIRYLAIDETDRMLERGHFQELHDLLERLNLNENKKKLRQNFVFSATLTLIHEIPKHLKYKGKFKNIKKVHDMTTESKLKKIVDMLGITNPKVVDISQGKGTSETLTECRITCGIEEKDYYLYYFLKKHPGRTLIFCNSIGCVRRLATLLGLLECHPLPLHASMQQRQRIKNLERFRDTENAILVATDVAARGLDIPSVEHVLHYQTPRTSESYVHRSGRTARASKQGITVLLIEPQELRNYIKLCRTLEKSEDLPTFPIERNFLNAVKQIVNVARELDKLQLQVRKANSEEGWFQKAADDMDIIVDDFAKKYDKNEAHHFKKAADVKRKQLSSLLSVPIFPKGYNSRYPLNMELTRTFMDDMPKEETALHVMKSAIELEGKKKGISLFKARKETNKKNVKVNLKIRKNVKSNKINKSNKRFRRK